MDTATPYRDTLAAKSREIYADLCNQLPKFDEDGPEDRETRDRRAMQAVFALHPYDDFEARLATRIVAMDAQSADGLRLAGRAANDPPEARRCLAQAASMARQSDSTLRLYKRMQAERDKGLAAMHPAHMERAGYWFREVSASDHPAPPPETDPAADGEFRPTPAQLEADAKLYEAMYPDRVARICAAGGLPPDLDFGPPDPTMVAALLRRAAERVAGQGRHNGGGIPRHETAAQQS
jgi:hypothetical protein